MSDENKTTLVLGTRDFDFITNRLYGDDKAWLALERLQKLGHKEEADELMKIVKNYADQLRQFRRRFELRR